MPFPVVKKCANVTHVFDSAGNIRLPQVYKGGQIRRAIGWVARGLPETKLR